MNGNSLRVIIRTTPAFAQQIQDDLKDLQSLIPNLPGNMEVTFEPNSQLRAEVTPSTHFGIEMTKGLPAVCEFPDRHFEDPPRLRTMILLHELIHAKQRQTILRSWDAITVKKLEGYNQEGLAGLLVATQQDRFSLSKNHTERIGLIHEFYKIIFEAWNHLELKKDYSQFFEPMLVDVCNRISNGTKNGTYDDWGPEQNLNAFVKVLEATFFAKITAEIPISFEFIKLAEFWRGKLRQICTENEFKILLTLLDPMTNPNQFPKLSGMELQYAGFCQLIFERRVFEN